jgi:hypothetical protein
MAPTACPVAVAAPAPTTEAKRVPCTAHDRSPGPMTLLATSMSTVMMWLRHAVRQHLVPRKETSWGFCRGC